MESSTNWHPGMFYCLIVAFIVANNISMSLQYEFRWVPVKSIDRVGPSLGKMKQLRNSGHILCLKQSKSRREFCERAFKKVPQISSRYILTEHAPGNEYAFRIEMTNKNESEIVFACGCPTTPLGVYLMGWLSGDHSVVEVLDYESSNTLPLSRIHYEGRLDYPVTQEEIRRLFLKGFLEGQRYLLEHADQIRYPLEEH